MFSLIFAFVLAHLLGDYVFQTNWIYRKKIQSFWGGIYHALEVFAALALVFFPMFFDIWLWFFLYTVFHFLQDNVKVFYNQKGKSVVMAYFLDQLGHYFALSILGFGLVHFGLLSGENFWIPFDVLFFLVLFIFVTRFWDITIHIFGELKHLYRADYLQMFYRAIPVIIFFLIWEFFV